MDMPDFWAIVIGVAQCLSVDVAMMGMLGRRGRSIMGKTVG